MYNREARMLRLTSALAHCLLNDRTPPNSTFTWTDGLHETYVSTSTNRRPQNETTMFFLLLSARAVLNLYHRVQTVTLTVLHHVTYSDYRILKSAIHVYDSSRVKVLFSGMFFRLRSISLK